MKTLFYFIFFYCTLVFALKAENDLDINYIEINGYTIVYVYGGINTDALKLKETSQSASEFYLKTADAQFSFNGDLDGSGTYDAGVISYYEKTLSTILSAGNADDSFGVGSEVRFSDSPGAHYVSSYDGEVRSYGSDSAITQLHLTPLVQDDETVEWELGIDEGYGGEFISMLIVLDHSLSDIGLSDGDYVHIDFENTFDSTQIWQKAHYIDSESSDLYAALLDSISNNLPDYYDEIVDNVLNPIWDGNYDNGLSREDLKNMWSYIYAIGETDMTTMYIHDYGTWAVLYETDGDDSELYLYTFKKVRGRHFHRL
ncbi:hypothetical protein [Rubellicoccus peritrichatus]|uniref:Uncharacterized protein n=1 Tax=Rubellicoccus peritrichatus TaxID=3080537 RepID=A0AAQ3LCL6_9BACT|nr:hypothetical protein [Puniceicoccus sp. CR14]WOO43326.1 hypothetical protein RZN69_09510 [Puniceicoccus sp. CR14]